jgi:hypothetical protein
MVTIFVIHLQALFLELACGLLVKRYMASIVRAMDRAALRERGRVMH